MIEFSEMRLREVIVNKGKPRTDPVAFRVRIQPIEVAQAVACCECRNRPIGDREGASLNLGDCVLSWSHQLGDQNRINSW
jgi:hypothetical protein